MIPGKELFRREVPWAPHLKLVGTARELHPIDGRLVVELHVENVESRRVCSFKDGELVFKDETQANALYWYPSTAEAMTEAERLCLAVMPKDSPVLKPEFQSVLKDPFWQEVLDIMSVHYVLSS